MFDDLIPTAAPAAGAPPAAAPTAGMFDDLIPKAAAKPDADFSGTRAVTQGATGFNEGFAKTVLRPLDVIPYFASKAMGGEGVHPFEGTFREHFVEPMGQPQNRGEEVLRSGGNMVGENLPLMATGAGVAGSALRSGTTLAAQTGQLTGDAFVGGGKLAPAIRGAADTVLEGMAANPVASAVAENAGAFAAGAGGKVGRNVAEDAGASPQMQDLSEAFGQTVAGPGAALYGKVAPTRLAAKGAKYVADKTLDMVPEAAIPEKFKSAGGSYAERKADKLAYGNREGKYEDPNVPAPPEGNFATRRMDAGQAKREEKATAAASKEFNQIVEQPDAAANLAEAQRLEQTIPGFKPGVAKATQDPALLKLQDSMESRATGDELRGVQRNADASTQAIRDYKENIIPSQGEHPQDVVAGANAARVQGVNDRITQQAEGVRGQIAQRSAELPDAERASSGAAFRKIHASAEQASSDRTSELRKAIANPETQIQVGDKTMTIDEALNRRAAINQEQRKYAGTAGTMEGADKMAELSAERALVDRAIEGVNQPGMKEYRDYYRDEHVPKYQEGPGRDTLRYDRFEIGKNDVLDEKVLGQFGGPNNISAAKQFTATHGENPEAVKLMVDHQLGRLKAAALDSEGAVKPGAVNKFLANNRELLDALPPGVREAVAAKNPDDLYARLGQLEGRQRAVAKTKVAGLLGTKPEAHIDAALNDWRIMKELRASMRGDPQAEMALRKAVIDKAPDPMNVEKFKAFLDGNDRALRQVLEPTHLKALQDVLSAAKINNTLPRPTGTVDLPGSLADKGAKMFGISVPSLLQRVLSVKQGRMSAEYGVADVATRAIRQFSNKEIENAWKEALYNPKVAKDLQLMVKGGGATPIQLARMRNYMLSAGLHDTEESKDESKTPQTAARP